MASKLISKAVSSIFIVWTTIAVLYSDKLNDGMAPKIEKSLIKLLVI